VYHHNNSEIRDTLSAIDKAVANREIRTAVRLSRQVRKYRNIIKAHHLLQITTQLGIEFNETLLRNSSTFDPNFTGTFDLSKPLSAKFNKVLEIEAFVRCLIILFLWR
jgi:26S proteasome regulatory subunit N3